MKGWRRVNTLQHFLYKNKKCTYREHIQSLPRDVLWSGAGIRAVRGVTRRRSNNRAALWARAGARAARGERAEARAPPRGGDPDVYLDQEVVACSKEHPGACMTYWTPMTHCYSVEKDRYNKYK